MYVARHTAPGPHTGPGLGAYEEEQDNETVEKGDGHSGEGCQPGIDSDMLPKHVLTMQSRQYR